MPAMITGWGKCLPPAVLTNDDLATIMDNCDEWITSRTGIRERLGSVLASFLLLWSATVSCGPPLVSDDPNILQTDQWEFIVAINAASQPSIESAQAPLLDVSYGVTSNLQISLALPRQWVEPKGEGSSSGWGNGQIGYKWRFFTNDTIQLAVAPLYSHPLDHGSTVREVTPSVSVLSLPFVASLLVGKWTWNFQGGFSITSNSTNLWDYAVAVGHPVGSSAQLWVEVWGVADGDFDTKALNYRVGLDYALDKRSHILAAIGGPITSSLGPEDELDRDFYLGLQWFR